MMWQMQQFVRQRIGSVRMATGESRTTANRMKILVQRWRAMMRCATRKGFGNYCRGEEAILSGLWSLCLELLMR